MSKANSVEIKILSTDDLEDILNFELSQLPGEGLEKEMQAWHAPWRREALEHYLPKGWSFIQRSEGQILGYILCQPILFFQGWTQSLWIEHLSATTKASGEELIETVYRWARDKHLQKVFFRSELKYVDKVTFAQTTEPVSLSSFSSTKI